LKQALRILPAQLAAYHGYWDGDGEWLAAEQFWPVLCRASHYALIAAHIVSIGSIPRLAEDVVRLVPVFPPGNAW